MNTEKWLKAGLFCLVGTFVFTSCDDDDDPDYVNPPSALQQALEQKYGSLSWVEWDREGTYYVADFRKDGREHEAWFTGDGRWMMTEIDLQRNLSNLPETVRTGFESTVYAASPWVVEDVDKLEREGYAELYIIEVERYTDDADVVLHFDLAGTLVREWSNTGGSGTGGISPDLFPSQLPEAITTFLDEHFSGAQIAEVERENGRYEVDLYKDYRSFEVHFQSDGEWIRTQTDVRLSELPAVVREAVQTRYPAARMDDAKQVDTPTENYYVIDLDNYGFDLKVSLDGASVTEIPD